MLNLGRQDDLNYDYLISQEHLANLVKAVSSIHLERERETEACVIAKCGLFQ